MSGLDGARFEHAPEAMLVVDLEGRVVRANRSAEEMFGRAHEEMKAIALADLSADRPAAERLLVYAKGSRIERQPARAWKARRHTEATFWTRVTASPTEIGDEHAMLLVVVPGDEPDEIEVGGSSRVSALVIGGALGTFVGGIAAMLFVSENHQHVVARASEALGPRLGGLLADSLVALITLVALAIGIALGALFASGARRA